MFEGWFKKIHPVPNPSQKRFSDPGYYISVAYAAACSNGCRVDDLFVYFPRL
jgi:hypothetical protein